MRKKLVLILIGAAISLSSMSIGAYAATNLEQISAYLNKGLNIKINGKAWTPKDAEGNTVYPITYNGTTYLPVRAVGEAIGLKVGWEGETNTVLLGETPLVNNSRLEYVANMPILKKDGKKYQFLPQSVYVDSKGTYYAALTTMLQLTQASAKSEFKIENSNNPFIDGILSFTSRFDNFYSMETKFINVQQSYYEIKLYNSDKSKEYFITNKPGEEKGAIFQDGSFLLPINEVLATLKISQFSIENDEQNKMVYFTVK